MNITMKISLLLWAVITINFHLAIKMERNEMKWELYKKNYVKVYKNKEEESFRKEAFFNNTFRIKQHNILHAKGSVSYKLEINENADLYDHEISKLSCLKQFMDWPKHCDFTRVNLRNISKTVPSSINWYQKGAVTPVKDQLACGACWAFAAVGALESHHYMQTGKLLELSVQNVLDCTEDYNAEGCDGGLAMEAFCYVAENGGIDVEQYYPYQGQVGECRYNSKNSGHRIKGFALISVGDEETLKAAVASSPVAVAIDTGGYQFHFYHSGIFHLADCRSDPESLDHAMLVVGYGSEGGKDYWLAKNSWGSNWGQGGFIKMARNANNNCGIATMASYPFS